MLTPSTEDGITIRTMKVEDYVLVKPFIRDQFYTGEPLAVSSGRVVEECNDKFDLELISQGTSLVAINSVGCIVGIVLARVQYHSDTKKHRMEAEQLEPGNVNHIKRLLSRVERDANIFERYGVSKALLSHITAVDSSMRGKGLGTRLAATLMDVGRAKGFPLMVAYCTSFYSARQKEALGMECAHALLYAEYKDEQGRVVFQTPEPHTQVRVMVIRL